MSEQPNLKKDYSKFYAWLKIARIQFYPMTFIAYGLGAVCAFITFHRFSISIFLLGYTALFLVELCAILANEYYDYDTDRINKNFSIFTGGSRILVLVILIVIFHAIILLSALFSLIKSNNFDRLINQIMGLAMSYIVWFGLIPSFSLLLTKETW